ncbi:MAG TPA: hypothetical protein VFT21_04560 [Gemmatimonadaceae bacterium]|nr:hypothetical protein [Gemmatimonadaceae bacterium]
MDPRILSNVIGVVTVIVAMTGSLAFLSILKYWLTRKRSQPFNMPGYDPEALAKLQASVDAISIEVERISEGQRFTTRLLNERAAETTPV